MIHNQEASVKLLPLRYEITSFEKRIKTSFLISGRNDGSDTRGRILHALVPKNTLTGVYEEKNIDESAKIEYS